MSARTPPAPEPAPAGFRRRVVVELTGPELALLDAAERAHGTKRAAVIAGLRALADGTRSEAPAPASAPGPAPEPSGAADAEAAQRAARAAAEARCADLTEQLDEARAALAELRGVRAAEGERAEAQRLQLAARLAKMSARAVDALYCARCERWAPEAEWAWKSSAEGAEDAHHAPCGDHGNGVISPSSRLARRARAAGSPPGGPKKSTR